MLIIAIDGVFACATQNSFLHNDFESYNFLMLSIFLMIKSLFFNIEINLAKNNIIL